METCYFCGTQYHPMAVWIRNPNQNMDYPAKINVCEFVYQDGELKKFDECKNKAIELGYVYRKDLTPKR